MHQCHCQLRPCIRRIFKLLPYHHTVGVPVDGCLVYGGVPCGCLSVQVSYVDGQPLHHLQLTVPGGNVQDRLPLLVCTPGKTNNLSL